MATVRIERLGKDHGDTQVLGDVSLEVADGELLVLVGPSGCGKSTLLRCIAGLETLTRGRILIDGRDVTHVEPRDRDIAMVFQSYALYPHLSVRENLAFGLKMRKTPRAEIDERVKEAAAMLGLEQLLERRPSQLSGGQRQRVAMGRAVVRRPKVFLFDEPLSNLDAALRGQMRVELMRLHQKLSATMIYVTHDQVEAMTLADRIAVLNKGALQQVGPPAELYETPANLFVARFIGTPEMNVLDAAEARRAELVGELPDGVAQVGIRAESVQVSRRAAVVTSGAQAQVEVVEQLGHDALVHLTVENMKLIARVEGREAPRPGDRVRVSLPPASLHAFTREGARVELPLSARRERA
jgi:multiple sugar transport system ATP-binding protein